MRKEGYACLVDPDRGTKETDTYSCCHCNRIIHAPVNKKIEEVGDFCRNCMRVHCLSPACFECIPLLKKIERMEAQAWARRSYV